MLLDHKPVLLKEVLEVFKIKPNGRYVDGTLGLGGHAVHLAQQLGPDGRLLGLDVDPVNLVEAENRLQPFGDRTITRRSNFRGLPEVLRELGWDQIDGLLLDLGISSVQLDDPKRGFTFQAEGPLDMRLDPHASRTAEAAILEAGEEKLIEQFREFGEYKSARRLAKKILEQIQNGELRTTGELARLCERTLGRSRKTHPATRIFLALRCLVNNELEDLFNLLNSCPPYISVGGKIAVISFHSGEDRLVKRQFIDLEQKGFKRITRKPIVPSLDEMDTNPRSRSAKLRVVERIS